jgi:hypothetical protein
VIGFLEVGVFRDDFVGIFEQVIFPPIGFLETGFIVAGNEFLRVGFVRAGFVWVGFLDEDFVNESLDFAKFGGASSNLLHFLAGGTMSATE